MKNLENLTIQEKIEYLRQNPIYWGKLGTVNDATLNGEESIEQYFEIEKQLDSFENIYRAGVSVFSAILPSGWIGVDEYDYEVTDFVLEKFFARLPNAYIIPRIKLTVPLLWCSAYPKDVHVYYNGPKTEEEIKALVGTNAHDYYGFPNNVDGKKGSHINKDGVIAMQSFSSEQWKTDASKALRSLIKHLEASPYADRIIGYHLAYGMCGETSMWGAWEVDLAKHGDYGLQTKENFIQYAKKRGVTVEEIPSPIAREVIKEKNTQVSDMPTALTCVKDKSFSALFYQTAGESGCEEYSRFISENNADAINRFCSVVKQETKEKLAGVFYGYIVDIHDPCDTGHLAIDNVLASPFVDFVAGPKGYCRVNSGDPGFPQAVTQSINLKKLWLDEVDNRTHIAKKADCNIAKNMAQTRSQFWREFSKNLSANQGYWWMDLGGGWYDDEEIVKEIQLLKKTSDDLVEKPKKSVTEILLVLDDDVMHKIRPLYDIGFKNISQFCNKIKECGAPVDLFRRKDLEEIDVSSYKLVIFLNPFIERKEDFEKIKGKFLPDTIFMFDLAPSVFDGEKATVDNIQEFLGFELAEMDVNNTLPELANNNLPLVYVKENEGILPLARYSDGKISFAKKENVVFCALPEILSLQEIRSVMKLARVHLYADEGFSVNADSRFIYVTSVAPFNGFIQMPNLVNATNAYTGEIYTGVDKLPCNYGQGESACFIIE